ncbi:MAG: 2Fe-2S iron-sulfur cluster binding domain-containing protein [Spirosoma sp.]|nr:2Fe-2S iron-sulfur cluster binding domain-containing protein [Spirosoma sp.]
MMTKTICKPYTVVRACTVLLLINWGAWAQSDHQKHHPQQATMPSAQPMSMSTNPAPDSANGKMAGGMKGGMKGGMENEMGNMMEMGKSPPKELFPSMMQAPLDPAQRDALGQFANERIRDGNSLLTSGLQALKSATEAQNQASAQTAMEQIHQGQSLLKSGLAAQRTLAEGTDPRITALSWFKQQMNLLPVEAIEQPHGFFGLSWFHYITMLSLALFVVAVVGLYIQKMKRANALVAKLAGISPETPAPASDAIPTTTTLLTPVSAVNPDIAPSKPNSWSGTLLVTEIFDETSNVKTFRLADPIGGKLPFNYLPGQFITVTIEQAGVPVKRSYTIASSPTHRDFCEITVKHEPQGIVSHYLHTQVKEGALLQFTGPSGKFTFSEADAESVVLIAGGVGITPMMSVVRYLTDRSWKKDIFLLFSCKDRVSIIFREELEYLQKRYANLHVTISLSQENSPAEGIYLSGRITKEVLNARVPDITSHRIHICGPVPMIDAVKQILSELNVPKENVRVELFPAPAPPKKTPVPPLGATSSTDTAAVVTFVKSNKKALLTPDKSILEASEEVGVNIDYSCRVGTCGICKTKLLTGSVTMAVEDALDDDDRARHIILACQAKATGPVAVDA